jgi:hypothetical protein
MEVLDTPKGSTHSLSWISDSNLWRDILVNFAQFLKASRELAPGNSSNMNEFDTQCSPLRSEEGPVFRGQPSQELLCCVQRLHPREAVLAHVLLRDLTIYGNPHKRFSRRSRDKSE